MDLQFDKILEKIKKDKEVIAAALFGSSLKGKGRDIDLCIFLGKKINNKEATKKRIALSGQFGDKFDINIFQQLPIYVRIRIIKEGKIIFCRDEDRLYEIAFDTVKEFDSYKNLYEMYLSEVKNGPRKNSLKI